MTVIHVAGSGLTYSGKQHVPLLMSLRRHGAASWECLLQQLHFRHGLDGKFPPVRKRSAAALAANLIGEEVHRIFLNAIILWLYKARFAFIEKSQQPLVMDRGQDELMDSGINAWWRWMPHHAK